MTLPRIAGVFLVTHFAVKAWQIVDLKRDEARLDAEIAQIYQQVMPGAPIPDPLEARRQFEMRLSALRGGGEVSGGMMTTIGVLRDAIAQTPGVTVEALSYRDNTTDVRIYASSVDELDKIQHAASERGLVAEIQSASPRDSKVEGRMKFKQTSPERDARSNEADSMLMA